MDFTSSKRLQITESISTNLFRIATYLVILIFALILGRIIVRGAPVLYEEGLSFLTEKPQILVVFHDEDLNYHRMTTDEFRAYEKANPDAISLATHTHNYSTGGVFSPLVGTIFLIIICIVFAMSIGVSAAVFLSEYSNRGAFIDAIRLAIINLAGVPSVVFGLFGFAFFCFAFPIITKLPPAEISLGAFVLPGSPNFSDGPYYLSFQGFGPSMLSAGLTLACMVLPVIITACEESLRAVPQGFRDASLALGATKWQTIRKSVLPYALPGMLTASVLAVTRVAGETAPIMYTGAFATGNYPWEKLNETNFLWKITEFFTRGVEAMPYHIYVVSAKIPQEDAVRPMQDGAVLVFMGIVMLLAGISVYLRQRVRSKLKW